MSGGGSGKRIGGVLLAFVGLVGLVGGGAVLTLPTVPGDRSVVPLAVALIGLAVLVLGVRLVVTGERDAKTAASIDPAAAPEGGRPSPVAAVGALLLLAAGGWYYFGGGLEQQAARTMEDIEDKVAADAVVQYGIAKRNGTKIDACVHAGLVAAAYLQAKDEAQYRQWKQTEGSDCEAAGVPR